MFGVLSVSGNGKALAKMSHAVPLCVGSDTGSGDGSSGSHKYHRVGGKAHVWPMQSLPKCWLVPRRPKALGRSSCRILDVWEGRV